MDKFCTYCGATLEEGQTCQCSQSKEAAQATVQENTSNNGNPEQGIFSSVSQQNAANEQPIQADNGYNANQDNAQPQADNGYYANQPVNTAQAPYDNQGFAPAPAQTPSGLEEPKKKPGIKKIIPISISAAVVLVAVFVVAWFNFPLLRGGDAKTAAFESIGNTFEKISEIKSDMNKSIDHKQFISSLKDKPFGFDISFGINGIEELDPEIPFYSVGMEMDIKFDNKAKKALADVSVVLDDLNIDSSFYFSDKMVAIGSKMLMADKYLGVKTDNFKESYNNSILSQVIGEKLEDDIDLNIFKNGTGNDALTKDTSEKFDKIAKKLYDNSKVTKGKKTDGYQVYNASVSKASLTECFGDFFDVFNEMLKSDVLKEKFGYNSIVDFDKDEVVAEFKTFLDFFKGDDFKFDVHVDADGYMRKIVSVISASESGEELNINLEMDVLELSAAKIQLKGKIGFDNDALPLEIGFDYNVTDEASQPVETEFSFNGMADGSGLLLGYKSSYDPDKESDNFKLNGEFSTMTPAGKEESIVLDIAGNIIYDQKNMSISAEFPNITISSKSLGSLIDGYFGYGIKELGSEDIGINENDIVNVLELSMEEIEQILMDIQLAAMELMPAN